MDSCTDIDDTVNAFNCKGDPVKHLIEGLNLKAEDFRERQFDLHGITVTLDRVEAEYPVIIANGKPHTDFYLVLYCRKGDQEHDVLVGFPYDKQKQALELYEALDYCDLNRAACLWDSDEDEDRDDYWGCVKTVKADKCGNPFSLLNAVCHCSEGIQDLLKCRETSDPEPVAQSIRDFASCTDFMVNKALSIMHEYCRKQCSPSGFDVFSTPVRTGGFRKDIWRSYVFCDEENGTYRGAFHITLRGGQRGWLIANNEQKLLAMADRYPKLADLVADWLETAREQRNFKPTSLYPLEEFYAGRMRDLLVCLARIAETPVVPSDRQAAADFMTWGLEEAERLGKRSLAIFKGYQQSNSSATTS